MNALGYIEYVVIVRLLFSQMNLCIDFEKNGFGNNLGDFFTKSSGHLDYTQIWRFFIKLDNFERTLADSAWNPNPPDS
jgi:hypothetical protein